jgi:3-mercaptopyruvate sulfurtransferase SseA
MKRPLAWAAGALGAGVLLLSSTLDARAQSASTGAVPRMTLEEFKKGLDAGTVLSVDVRGAEAYRAGHIPGSMLLGDVSSQLDELKAAKKTIVTYCT